MLRRGYGIFSCDAEHPYIQGKTSIQMMGYQEVENPLCGRAREGAE